MQTAKEAVLIIVWITMFLGVCLTISMGTCFLGSMAGCQIGAGTAFAVGVTLFVGATMAAVSQ